MERIIAKSAPSDAHAADLQSGPRRVLILSSFYPPFQQGGAEISSYNFAQWLVRQGHTVAVLTTAPTAADAAWGVIEEGVTIYRVHMPRPYSVFDRTPKPAWKKALWHILDHASGFNRSLLRRVVDEFRPDIVNPKIVQGLGHNMIGELGRTGLPVVYSQHDQGLGCINMSRYRDGAECTGHCAPCRLSTRIKVNDVKTLNQVAFISPSRANLESVAALVGMDLAPGYAIANPNHYPVPDGPRPTADHTRFLFIARLHESKGFDVIFEALSALVARFPLSLTVLGSGPREAEYRARCDGLDWVRFEGHVSLERVGAFMHASDALLVPSVWKENSPGVVLHAQLAGLPVIASRTGGIPELVEEGRDAILLPPGDVAAWQAALEAVLADPAQLETLRAGALAAIPDREPEHRAEQMWEVFEATLQPGRPTPSIGPKETVFPR